MNVTESTPFRTRAASQEDFVKGTQYVGASGGVIWPGNIAEKVLCGEISFGTLFAYCFRRFGFPNSGGDGYKDVACYTLVTPMPGLFLCVRIIPTTAARLMFGYLMTLELQQELLREDRERNREFHRQFSAWRKANGRLLPRDAFEGTGQHGDYDQREDMRLFHELLECYCADGGTHYDSMPAGPKTQEVLDAIAAALTDLKTPVAVDGEPFSVIDDFNVEYDEPLPAEPAQESVETAPEPVADAGEGDDEEEDEDEIEVAAHHPSAGYFVPPAYMADPERFVKLSEKLIKLGDGDLARGIETLLNTPESTS